MSTLRRIVLIGAGVLGWALCAWLALGVWSWAPGGVAVKILAALSVFLVTWVWGFQRMARWRFWLGRSVLLVGLVLLLLPQPHNERTWTPEHAGTLEVFDDDGRLMVRGLRMFRWHTAEEADPAWGSRTVLLDTVDSVWLTVEPFTADSPLAHILVSFGYRDQTNTRRYLAISVEARRELHEAYHPILGVFRRYELAYVVGEESDLIGLRAVHRAADVRLYPTTATPEQARTLLMAMLDRALKLQEEPEFYHSIWNNCAGNLAAHLRELWPGSVPRPEWRLLFTGGVAKAAHANGLIAVDPADPRAAIRERAQAAGTQRADFSALIRKSSNVP